MRGRNRSSNNKGPNPLTRSFESNGPDIKVRGTAQHIAEKYSQLARDAQASGDPVAAENYFQHAEHYIRIISAAQEQFRQQSSQYDRYDDEGEEGADEGGTGFAYPSERNEALDSDTDPSMQPQPFEYRSAGEQPQREGREYRQPRAPREERGERFDRNERQARNERPNRNERPERAERQEQPEYAERGERPERQERPERGERRSRFLRRDRQPMADGERRSNRRDDDRQSGSGQDEDFRGNGAGALPAFLTAPIRAPAPVEEPDAPPPSPATEQDDAPRPRRRRTTRATAPETSTEPVGD